MKSGASQRESSLCTLHRSARHGSKARGVDCDNGDVTTATAMPRPPRLIAELLALTRPWGWTLKDLARELGISEVTLGQLRSGRRRVSFNTFSHIVDRFGENTLIKGVAWQYARDYYKPDEKPPAIAAPANLPAAATHVLRRYVEGFADELTHAGRGLFVVSGDTALLTSAVTYLRHAFDAKDVRVTVLRADQEPAAADRRMALVAPLLIIERVEFLHAVVADLLRQRDDILRPVVVTSTAEPESSGDEYLRRVFLTRMRRVDLVPIALPPPATSQPAVHAQE
jgi:transcriptional regulator with XRE-family HTH domain